MPIRDTDHAPDPSEDELLIAEQASEWQARCDAGLTPAEAFELSQWLEADPRHAALFAELGATWDLLDKVSAARPPLPAPPDPHLLVPPQKSFLTRGWKVTAGLAAAAALMLGLFWQRPATRPTLAIESAQVSTEIGSLRTITLPDRSTLTLNTNSLVEYEYSSSFRKIHLLRGEAHFEVTKDAARPFLVSAGNVEVGAVGTAFNVHLRAETVEVLVTEGKVKVDDHQGRSLIPAKKGSVPPVLVAGERVILPRVGSPSVNVHAVEPAAIARALAWQERRLEFYASPLSEVVAEFNRYNQHQLVIADARLAARKFGGIFRADGHRALVHLLEQDFGASVEEQADKTILSLR